MANIAPNRQSIERFPAAGPPLGPLLAWRNDLLDIVDRTVLAADDENRRCLGEIDRIDPALDLGVIGVDWPLAETAAAVGV